MTIRIDKETDKLEHDCQDIPEDVFIFCTNIPKSQWIHRDGTFSKIQVSYCPYCGIHLPSELSRFILRGMKA